MVDAVGYITIRCWLDDLDGYTIWEGDLMCVIGDTMAFDAYINYSEGNGSGGDTGIKDKHSGVGFAFSIHSNGSICFIKNGNAGKFRLRFRVISIADDGAFTPASTFNWVSGMGVGIIREFTRGNTGSGGTDYNKFAYHWESHIVHNLSDVYNHRSFEDVHKISSNITVDPEVNSYITTSNFTLGDKVPIGLSCKIIANGGDEYRDWETDRKSTRLNSSHSGESRMPSPA